MFKPESLVGRRAPVYTRTEMFRLLGVAALVSLVALAACREGNETTLPATAPSTVEGQATIVPVTPAAKPPAVPESARPVEQTATLGRIIRRADEAPQIVMPRRLVEASCQDEVIVIETSEETIYAARSCDGFWDRDAQEAFSGQQVAIVLEVTEVRFRVLIETLAGAQSEFTVAGIWVE